MTLNPIGASSPCDTWSLSSRRYFTSIFLGYNTEISYLRATTNDGIDFERGYSIPSDQNVTISFATDKQLVGLNGYSSNKLLSSLGFIKLINCDNSTYVSDVSAQNFQTVDIAGIVISVNEKGLSRSRNKAILNSNADICVIADDDMYYSNQYELNVSKGYKKYPDADIIAYYVDSDDKRHIKEKLIFFCYRS